MTTRLRMCDDDGMVSREMIDPPPSFQPGGLDYLSLLNNLRSHTGLAPVTEPFECTGSAHLAGTVFHCTSPAHGPVVDLTGPPPGPPNPPRPPHDRPVA